MLPIYLLFASLAGVKAALTYKGVDWSSILVTERAGKTYKTASGTVQPFETILKSSGVNAVRQRLWVNPTNGDYNLDYNIKLARRAKAAGLDVYLNMHFSDTWADPGNQVCLLSSLLSAKRVVLITPQKIPSGWPSDLSNLSWKLYNYTLDVSNAFANANIALSLISIGNEITPGLLLPTGSTKSYSNVATLLHSASAGIKDSNLYKSAQIKPKIMIHIDNGWNWNTQKNWYTGVLAAGKLETSDFDVMGVSYYPFYSTSATLSSLTTSLNNMVTQWGKEIMVVETDWPVSCPSPGHAFPADTQSIPFTVAGQKTWMRDVANVVKGVKNGLGTGLFYWEPSWIGNANLGSSCADNLMVDGNGVVRDSLGVFSEL